AMYTGRLAANTVLEALAAGDPRRARLKRYERIVFRSMRFYWKLVEEFYTTPFIELFMEPRHRYRIPDAVLAALSGELEGGWAVEWRRHVFFWLIRLHARWPLVPGVSFAEPVSSN